MSEILGPPRKVLFVEPDHDRFRLVLNQFPRLSRRVTWVTPSILSDAYGRAQDALKRGQPFDLVIIDIADETEIEQAFDLARNIKKELASSLIALALPELALLNRTGLGQMESVDYFMDQLGEEQALRALLLYEEKWKQLKLASIFLS